MCFIQTKSAKIIRVFLCLLLLLTIFPISPLEPKKAEAAISSWSSNGPVMPVGGPGTSAAIRSLALSPNFANDKTIFGGTETGHIFKSSDGGGSWVNSSSGLSGWEMSALAVSPNYANDNTLFAASSNGYGVFKSTNGGSSWYALSGLPGSAHWDFAISPNYAADQTIFISGNYGVYKSTDGGNSWGAVYLGLSSFLHLAISPNYAADQTIFVGTLWYGILKSTDGGNTWNVVNSGLPPTPGYPAPYIEALAISPNYANDHTLFTVVWGKGLFKSTDGGASWLLVNAAWGGLDDIAFSPNYAADQTLFVAGANPYGETIVLVSTDAGASWTQLPLLPVVSPLVIAVSPNFANDRTIFAGGFVADGEKGVYSYTFVDTIAPTTTLSTTPASPDGQNGWYKTTPSITFSSNEAGTTYYQWDSTGGVWSTYSTPFTPPEGEHTLYYYSVDTAGNVETVKSKVLKVDTQAPALTVKGAEEGRVYYDATVIYSASDNIDPSPIVTGAYSLDGIDQGSFASDKTFTAPGEYVIKVMATDAAGNTATKSVSFEIIAHPPGWTTNGPWGGDVLELAISPNYANDQTLFAAMSTGELLRSTDGGISWWGTHVITWLSYAQITSLAVSPNYANDKTIFVAIWGEGVKKVTWGDSSVGWMPVNTGLPQVYITSLAISPNYANDQTIFAGTWYHGVFKSTNGGNFWWPVNNGFSGYYYGGTYYLRASQLAISPNYANDQTIFAGVETSIYKSTNGGASWAEVKANTGVILSFAISPNYAYDRTIFVGTGTGLFYRSTAGGSSWLEINIGVSYDRISALVISPNYAYDGTVFAGTERSGVFKSTNIGSSGTWLEANEGLTNLRIRSLAISPNFANDLTIFAGTFGDGVFKSATAGSLLERKIEPIGMSLVISPNYTTDQTIFAGTWEGVFKSTNGGSSWTAVNTGLLDTHIRSLAISPNYANDQTIFAGTAYGGVYKSVDGGSSWTAVNTGLPDSWIFSLAISPNYVVDQTIFAAAWGKGVYKSTDGGTSWTAVNTGLTQLYITSLAISSNYANDQTIFAGTWYNGLFKSTDGGASWTAVNTGLSTTYIISLALSPNYANDQTIFAAEAGKGVYKSTDGGASWTAVNTGLSTTYIISLALSPNYANDQTIFTGTSEGIIFKSINGGSSWTLVTVGISSWMTVYSFAISPNYAKDETVFVGTHSGVFKIVDKAWEPVLGLHIYSLASSPNFKIDKTVFAGTRYGLYKSTDGGISWNWTVSWFGRIHSLAVSPNYTVDRTVFAFNQYSNLYKSIDGGLTWTPLTGFGLTLSEYSPYSQLLAISPNYANDQTVFAGTWGKGVYKSTDGGTSWTAVNTGLTQLYITSLAISSNYANDQTIFAGTWYNGLFKSTNGGASWSSITLSYYFGSSVQSIVVSPNYAVDKTIFFSLEWESQIYKSTDGGSSWTATYYAYSPILAISPNYATDQTIFAANPYGRVYRSSDGGSTWSLMDMTGFTDRYLTSLVVSHNTIFAGTFHGVFGYMFDTTPPTTTLSPLPASPDGDNGWYKTIPSITLSSNESGITYYQWDSTAGTWTTYSPPFTTPEGEHTLYYYSVDAYGNTEEVKGAVFKVDTTPPTDPTLSSPSHTVGGWSNDNTIDVAWSGASDTISGIDGFSLEWSTQAIITPDTVKDFEETISTATSPPLADGSWHFHLRTKDNAGNWTSTVHLGPFNIDTVAPTTTLTSNPVSPDGQNGWYKTTPSITLSSNETGNTYYQWDSTTGAWIIYSAPFNVPEGGHTLYYYSLDTAGNAETVKSELFKVDTAAPSSSISSPSEGALLNGISYTITGTSSDPSSSGVAKVEVSINGGAWQLATGTNSWSYSWLLPSDGTYNIRSRATDNAGNVETPGTGVNVTVDNTPPVTTLSPLPALPDGQNSWYKTTPSITLSSNEAGTTYYSWFSPTGPWITYSVSLAALEGEHTLYYYSVDTAGNTETIKSQSFRVDTQVPVVTIDGVSEGEYYYEATVSYSATDNLDPSPLVTATYSLDGVDLGPFASGTTFTTPGTYNVTVTATDAAGNVATESVSFTIIPPTSAYQVVGSSGGTVSNLTGTASVDIPPGALATDTPLTIEQYPDKKHSGFLLQYKGQIVSDGVYEFGPSGLAFATPVTITLSYDETKVDETKLQQFLTFYSPDGVNWSQITAINIDTVQNTVSFQVDHFSLFALFFDAPPEITITSPMETTYDYGQLLTISYNVADPETGITSQSAFLNGLPILNGQTVTLNTLGPSTFTVSATNGLGLTATKTVNFTVKYELRWSPPIKYIDETTTETYTMQDGSTLPIKFKLYDSSGNLITDPTLKVKVEGNGGSAVFILGTGDENIRLDPTTSEYIVNLHTKNYPWIAAGPTYYITVYAGGGGADLGFPQGTTDFVLVQQGVAKGKK